MQRFSFLFEPLKSGMEDSVKSIPKIIRRFVGIMTLSIILLFILNITFFAIVFVRNTSTFSPWDMADHAADALQLTDGGYFIADDVMAKLKEENAWAFLIDNDTRQVVWWTDSLPNNIPMQYTLSDIAQLTRGYVDGYPTFTGESKNGLLVLGFPRDRFWKHTRASWDYHFIANLPKNTMIILAINIVLIFLIYAAVDSKLLRSIRPITNGIQNLSDGIPVCLKEKGVLSELAEKINKTAEILQMQAEQLRKKETARANWIAGVSHDVRTPLSMIMGYAGQLEDSKNLSEMERKKAAVIVKQSSRIKDLINDLNLASKLEYDMQPLTMKQENAISMIRQVIVDFMNTNIDDKFPIEWKTADTLSACYINADKDLLKRAVSNLIQNSINHNVNGCVIYVSVDDNNHTCNICIEDNGIGACDEQIDRLNNTPHYMICGANTTEQRHGLGLLIVKQIIKGHHGEILIDHSEYGGFKVVLSIPK